ncbi:chaperone modulator CbpM [Variovorax sp. J22P271]|uniref:chaperone modulator CbpM n=1 Tax=Variovorax davisae TaxID=3053515 RepID=UPI002577CC61|nr:chaperone modulator CbpM [Variovorax sp. J22P271]MDM0030909.1 chaperone modulator CbpM [Variovorax sp. J22P271]
MTSSVSITTTTLSASHPLAAGELAHACGAQLDWVVQLVEVGIIESRTPAEQPDDWRFHGADLQCALEARRLERDFGVGLDAAALILDLEHEVRRLKGVLRAQGLEREI